MSDMPPIFSLIKRGWDKFPRYVIAKADAYGNAVYWNFEACHWHADENIATVFADVTPACWKQHDLLMEAVGERPVHRRAEAGRAKSLKRAWPKRPCEPEPRWQPPSG